MIAQGRNKGDGCHLEGRRSGLSNAKMSQDEYFSVRVRISRTGKMSGLTQTRQETRLDCKYLSTSQER